MTHKSHRYYVVRIELEAQERVLIVIHHLQQVRQADHPLPVKLDHLHVLHAFVTHVNFVSQDLV